jgi:hypothetical protein
MLLLAASSVLLHVKYSLFLDGSHHKRTKRSFSPVCKPTLGDAKVANSVPTLKLFSKLLLAQYAIGLPGITSKASAFRL